MVIGGGFAGLSAATALAEAGRARALSSRRVRTSAAAPRPIAIRAPANESTTASTSLAGCYTETLAFLRRIGRERALHRPSTLRVPMIDERWGGLELRLPPLAVSTASVGGVLAWRGLTWRERRCAYFASVRS